jgi:sugar/nucleoside kinase (ribokinase family)
VVFCNALETRHFTHVDDLQEAARIVGELVDLAFVTNGAAGCMVVQEGCIELIPGFRVHALDTVGAGDAFAAGALFGLTHGYSAQQSARWGNFLASRVVTQHGARLRQPVRERIGEIVG